MQGLDFHQRHKEECLKCIKEVREDKGEDEGPRCLEVEE